LDFAFLTESEGYKPAPYFANRGMKWIQLFHSVKEKDNDLKYYLTEFHRIVSLGLTKIKQKELGLNQS
jgi:predicted DNA-binding protein (MmcQ/YjbR family)